MLKLVIAAAILCSCCCAISAQTRSPTPLVRSVEFCEMIRNAAAYDGKQIRVRVLYTSAFEVSSFSNPTGSACVGKNKVWANFDESAESQSKPEIAQRLQDSFSGPTIDANGNITGQFVIRETQMVVTGTIYKPNKQGYGHTNIYSHKFVVSSVEELGPVKKTDPTKKP